MTHRELEERIGAIIPGAQFETDLDGQIIIYTGLTYNERSGEVDPFVEPFERPED